MRNLVWSYSFLSTYLRCRQQAEARYVTKLYPYKESPEMAYGNAVHSAFDKFIKGVDREFAPDIAAYEKWAKLAKGLPMPVSEHELGVTRDWRTTAFRARDAWGRCKVDFYSLNTDSAVLMDWKTGKPWEDPFELEVQAVCLNAHYPLVKNFVGMYVWLKEDRIGDQYEIGPQRLKETREKIEDTMKKVESEPWQPMRNALCGWCEYEHCRHYKDTRRK